MGYRYLKVNPQLSKCIRTVLVLDNSPENKTSKLPLFTNGTPVLLCRTKSTSAELEDVLQLTLYGESAPMDGWKVKKNETIIAYFFKPFSMPCLFNISAKELLKKPLELTMWNAHQTHALKTHFSYARMSNEKVAALDKLLLHQLQNQERACEIIRYATDQILLNFGTEVESEILDALKLNTRTFQRIFKKFVGVTPTQFRRICQFKEAFEKLKQGGYDKLIDVALDTGFSDQSHFIRSFKEYMVNTPKEYVKSGLRKKNEI